MVWGEALLVIKKYWVLRRVDLLSKHKERLFVLPPASAGGSETSGTAFMC